MPIQPVPHELQLPGLRAMKTVLTVDGSIAPPQRAVLGFLQRLQQTDHDLDALAAITPGELAAAFPSEGSEGLRRQLAQAMVALVVIREEVSPRTLAEVRRFAAALGIDDPLVDHLRQYAEGRIALLLFDYLRRSMPFNKGPERAEKIHQWLRALGHVAGLVEDTPLATRYRALGALPKGALGRELYDFYRDAGFPLPGEKGGIAETVVRHDLSHVLGGYGTTPEAEREVFAFQAGFQQQGAVEMFALMAFQMHAGVKLLYIMEPQKHSFDDPEQIERAFRAYERGARMNVDLMGSGWDFWAVIDRPVDELRRAYAISS